MNLFDKLAVSLLIIGQIEAAMPGAFSRVAETDRAVGAGDSAQKVRPNIFNHGLQEFTDGIFDSCKSWWTTSTAQMEV